MGALSKHKWTSKQFIEWSVAQGDRRYELEAGQVVEMAAEQAKHALTKFAAAKALENAISTAGLESRVFPDGMTIVVDNETVRLPDAAVQCAPVDLESTILTEPLILVEVVSPSSVSRDESYKLVEYLSVPSVVHYLVLFPDQRIVIHFSRGSEANKVTTKIMSDGLVELSPPGISVRVEDLLGPRPSENAERKA
jgi:Uma2 family endonuclease